MALSLTKIFATALSKFNRVTNTNSSSGWFVANNDTKTADSDVDDPSEAANTGTKAFEIDTSGSSYLDLAHLYVGTDPAADVKVRAFGFWRKGEDKGAIEPYQVSTSYPQTNAAYIGGGFWAPLYAPVASGAHEQTLHTSGAAPDVTNDNSSTTYKLKGGTSYATNGAERAIVLVSSAASAMTVGLVLGRVGN